jgi:hypothetical protein
VAEIVAQDDDSVRSVEKPIGVDSHSYRRRAAKRAYENLLFQRAAEEQIGRMPDEGETIHLVVSAAYRTVDLIPAWLALKVPVPIERLYVATLSFNRECLDLILELFDAGKVKSFALVMSVYDRANDPGRFQYAKQQLQQRGCRIMAMQNHCKVITALFADGTGYSAEGSANLRSHSTTENVALTNDVGLHQFHASWMEEALAIPDKDPGMAPADPKPARSGFSQRRAGLGVLTVSRDKANRARLLAWKLSSEEDPAVTAALADELAALVEKALPVRPSGCVLTIPPQGASWPGQYFARLLGRRVATRLNMPLVELLERADRKLHHGRRDSLSQDSYAVNMAVPAAIVLDDLITSGRTMNLSLDALRAAKIPAWGFALNGS